MVPVSLGKACSVRDFQILGWNIYKRKKDPHQLDLPVYDLYHSAFYNPFDQALNRCDIENRYRYLIFYTSIPPKDIIYKETYIVDGHNPVVPDSTTCSHQCKKVDDLCSLIKLCWQGSRNAKCTMCHQEWRSRDNSGQILTRDSWSRMYWWGWVHWSHGWRWDQLRLLVSINILIRPQRHRFWKSNTFVSFYSPLLLSCPQWHQLGVSYLTKWDDTTPFQHHSWTYHDCVALLRQLVLVFNIIRRRTGDIPKILLLYEIFLLLGRCDGGQDG